MTREQLGRLLSAPETSHTDHLQELKVLCSQYPYCAPLQTLVLVLLHKENDLRYTFELHERVLSLPDPRRLFTLLHTTMTPTRAETRTHREREEEHKGFGLIDSFLEKHPEDSSEIELLFTPTYPISESNTTDNHDDLIAQFLKQGEGAEKIEPLIAKDKVEEGKEETTSLIADDELLTETLARMYVRQAKYERAERILRQIYLEFPKKSGYFAEQLNFLEKLNKTNEACR